MQDKGAGLIVALAQRLQEPLGPIGKWAFLLGAWGAVFSSLLGVWQSVPYIFADFCRMSASNPDKNTAQRPLSKTMPYRLYLIALAIIPILGLRYGFQSIQKYYAVFGACFMPFLAAVLIYLNGRASLVGEKHKNSPTTNTILAATLAFFILCIYFVIKKKFGA